MEPSRRQKGTCFHGMQCEYGLDCRFAHTPEEIDTFERENRRLHANMYGRRRAKSANKVGKRRCRWKARCRWKLDCNFYHNDEEIRKFEEEDQWKPKKKEPLFKQEPRSPYKPKRPQVEE